MTGTLKTGTPRSTFIDPIPPLSPSASHQPAQADLLDLFSFRLSFCSPSVEQEMLFEEDRRKSTELDEWDSKLYVQRPTFHLPFSILSISSSLPIEFLLFPHVLLQQLQ
jgi:hypothetical protein